MPLDIEKCSLGKMRVAKSPLTDTFGPETCHPYYPDTESQQMWKKLASKSIIFFFWGQTLRSPLCLGNLWHTLLIISDQILYSLLLLLTSLTRQSLPSRNPLPSPVSVSTLADAYELSCQMGNYNWPVFFSSHPFYFPQLFPIHLKILFGKNSYYSKCPPLL